MSNVQLYLKCNVVSSLTIERWLSIEHFFLKVNDIDL